MGRIPAGRVALSFDGAQLACLTRSGRLQLWRLSTGERLREIHAGARSNGPLAFSPDATLLATTSEGGHVNLWSVTTGALAHVLPTTTPIHALTFSPSGDLLATGGEDGRVRLWNPSTGALVGTLGEHSGAVSSLAFAGDRLVSAAADGRLRVWDLATRSLLGWMAAGPEGAVCVAPDGSHRVQGDVRGWFWIADGLHRYEVGELDRWLPAIRVRDDEPFPWGRTRLPGLDG